MPVAVSRTLSAVAMLLLGLCASGCATVAPNSLSATDTASLRFTSIEVHSAPTAKIRWSAAEDEYRTSRNPSMTDSTSTPEARSYVDGLATQRLKAALERKLAGRVPGTRPARLVATIRSVTVQSVAERMLVGGFPVIQADIDVVDARTGAVLTRYSGDAAMEFAGNGFAGTLVDAALVANGADDLYDRTAATYAERFDAWLSRS